jgi:PAS domain S-box-containing protein
MPFDPQLPPDPAVALERGQAIFRLARIATWSRDPRDGRAWWSPELRELLGHNPGDEPALSDFMALVHEADRDRVTNTIAEALERADSYDYECRMVAPGGERLVHVRGDIERDAAGVPERITGTVQDITGWKLSEQVLAQTAALEAAVVDAALDCVIVIDAEGRVVEWNPAAETTFGYSRAVALGQELATLIIP